MSSQGTTDPISPSVISATLLIPNDRREGSVSRNVWVRGG